MSNELTYPFAVMHITQSYDGTLSHLPHMTGTPKEYALDEGEKDAGRGWAYCPCDRMKVVKLTGVGAKGTNALYLTSTEKCSLANGKKAVVTIQLVHPNDDDLKKLKVGQIFRRGEKICREGTDGNATGNHIHMAVGLGTIVGTGWQLNNKNKWVLVTTGGPIKPEDAFFIDPAFTRVKDSKGLKFRTVPAPSVSADGAASSPDKSGEPREVAPAAHQSPSASLRSAAPPEVEPREVAPAAHQSTGKYRVTANVLRVRLGTGTDTPVVAALSKGDTVEICRVKLGKTDGRPWGKIDKTGWICLDYAKAVTP